MSSRVLLTLVGEEDGELRLVEEMAFGGQRRVVIEILPEGAVSVSVSRWEITHPVFADALAGALTDAFPITPFAGRPPS